MKNEALNYSLMGIGVFAAVWLLAGLRINVELDTLVGWGTAGALLLMAPITYRAPWKRLTNSR